MTSLLSSNTESAKKGEKNVIKAQVETKEGGGGSQSNTFAQEKKKCPVFTGNGYRLLPNERREGG